MLYCRTAAGFILAAVFVFAAEPALPHPDGPLFHESFDDDALLKRGWYDGSMFLISKDVAGDGAGCIEYHWKAGTTNPDSSSGMRRLFEPTDTVYLRFRLRLSKNWGWTRREYHPHLITLMTTENGPYHGPAGSHLTVYVEPQEGKLRLAAQDIQNKDSPSGLTQGPLRGGFNCKFYDSREVLFRDDQWHTVEALFKLNSIESKTKKARADGIVRGWFDGNLVIDETAVVLRSADFPNMKFNQFLLLPYFGPGLLPHEQTLWIDDLAVAANRIEPLAAAVFAAPAKARTLFGPLYESTGLLKRPEGFETWVFVGANLGIEYREDDAKEPPPQAERDRRTLAGNFHNVYINPEAYQHYMQTGEFPDRTVLVLEIFEAVEGDPKGIVAEGRFPGERKGLAAAVKNKARPDGSKTDWAYYDFGRDEKTAKAFADKVCYDCHLAHASDDNVWVQFYPTLKKSRDGRKSKKK